jgi:hypothetical protein
VEVEVLRWGKGVRGCQNSVQPATRTASVGAGGCFTRLVGGVNQTGVKFLNTKTGEPAHHP